MRLAELPRPNATPPLCSLPPHLRNWRSSPPAYWNPPLFFPSRQRSSVKRHRRRLQFFDRSDTPKRRLQVCRTKVQSPEPLVIPGRLRSATETPRDHEPPPDRSPPTRPPFSKPHRRIQWPPPANLPRTNPPRHSSATHRAELSAPVARKNKYPVRDSSDHHCRRR